MKLFQGFLVFIVIFQSVNGLVSTVLNTLDSVLNALSSGSASPNDDVKFFCASQAHPDYQLVSISDLSVTTFDFSQGLSIFIHGYNSSYTEPVFVNFKNAYIASTSKPICFVDWNTLSNGFYPEIATVRTRIVQQRLTTFINFLVSEGCPLDEITFIGHSLGAHIAGFSGADFKGKVGQIVGLDPAGPSFSPKLFIAADDRLDPTDAIYVLIVHSCAGVFGIGYDDGDADFYINTGRAPQPGCSGLYATKCAHFLSVFIYQDTYTSNGNKCIGISCKNESQYKSKTCDSNNKEYLRYDLSGKKTGKYYMTVGADHKCSGN